MTKSAHRTATYADIEAASAHLIAEIVHGRLLTRRKGLPPVAGVALTALAGELRGADCRHGGQYVFIVKPELHLGPHIIVPTLGAWLAKRLAVTSDVPWAQVPRPDWIAEIVAMPAHEYELQAKLEIYAAAGITRLWLIDSVSRTLTVYELQERHWSVLQRLTPTDTVVAPPFTDSPFLLSELWPFDRPLSTVVGKADRAERQSNP